MVEGVNSWETVANGLADVMVKLDEISFSLAILLSKLRFSFWISIDFGPENVGGSSSYIKHAVLELN